MPMTPLLRELLSANRQAQHPDAKAALTACGLGLRGGPVWGVGSVTVQGEFYSPALPHEIGAPAVIVPAFEGGELTDLVAISLRTRATKTRLGYATFLGADWIDRARDGGAPLRLFNDPLKWLACGQRGAVLLDRSDAPFVLADVPLIGCDDDSTVTKLGELMQRPVRLPQFFVRELDHARP